MVCARARARVYVCVCVSPRPLRRAGLGRTCSVATSNLFPSSSRLQSPPRGPGPHAALHHAAQPPVERGLRATRRSQESRVSRRVVHPALCHFTHFPPIFLSPPLIFPVPDTLLSRPTVGAPTPPSPSEPPLPYFLFFDGVRVPSFFPPERGTCRRGSECHYSLSFLGHLSPHPGLFGWHSSLEHPSLGPQRHDVGSADLVWRSCLGLQWAGGRKCPVVAMCLRLDPCFLRVRGEWALLEKRSQTLRRLSISMQDGRGPADALLKAKKNGPLGKGSSTVSRSKYCFILVLS